MLKLETAQAERFVRLFDGLIGYVHAHLKEEGALDEHAEDDRTALMRACHEALWGTDGDTSLIDRFVEAGSLELDDAGRQAVLAWKEGIYHVFLVLCENDAMRFIFGNRVFVVRGSVMDIFDFMETIPGSLECVLLPFDGCVTVGTWMEELGDGLPHGIEYSCHTISYENDRKGLTISTAEQFLGVSSSLRDSVRLLEEDYLASREREAAPSNTEHRGALAGLSWQEREEALEKRKAEVADAEVLAAVEDSCVKSVPRTIDTGIRRLKRDDLDEFNRTQRPYHDLSYMNKKEATDYVVSMLSFGTESVVEDVMRRGGTHLLEGFRDVTQAGGSLSVPEGDLDAIRKLPPTTEPYLYVTHKGGRYQAKLVDEVYDVLQVIDWWDEALEEAQQLDEAVSRIESLASFRGFVPIADAKAAIADLASDEAEEIDDDALFPPDEYDTSSEADFVLEALGYRGRHGTVSCRLEHDWFDNVTFIADADMGGPARDSIKAILIAPWVKDMLAYRKDIPPRDMSDVEPGQTVFDWMRAKRSYRDLVAFLDERVPNGDDDYTFADEVAGNLVNEVRCAVHFASIQGFCNTVLKDTEIKDDAQVQRLQTLVTEVVYDVPRWLLNGWTDWERRS